VIAGLINDRAILMAMITNEDDITVAYERAVARTDLSVEIRDLLERHLTDERMHREWFREQLAALRGGKG
jgi:rubrerythrin